MTFTGTLIDDLMATVEDVETRARVFEITEMESLLAELCLAEPWLVSAQENENQNYDSKFLGVA
jgi:hypothetical protein